MSLYLHNTTASFLMDVVQEYSSFARYIGAKNMPKNENKFEVAEVNPPYFCADYIYVEQLDIKLFALSSTNLNVVNFIPNIEVSIKVLFEK